MKGLIKIVTPENTEDAEERQGSFFSVLSASSVVNHLFQDPSCP